MKASSTIRSVTLYQDAEQSALRAGLRYVSDQEPGIERRPWGRGFTYIDIDGSRIQNSQRRAWLESLAIPPNWQGVWICAQKNGHLVSTGRDQKGRKQYRYHPDWVALRKQIKFDRLIPFAHALPTLREKAEADIQAGLRNRSQSPTRTSVIAAAVQLLDNTFIRVGNLQYTQANKSYGLTTLRTRHVDIEKDYVGFHFVGKSGVSREISIRDPQLAKLVKRCKDIPGYRLFQYIDENGDRQAVDSGDVNDYLQSVMGEAFTAKDFRTWGGTVTATDFLYRKLVERRDQLESGVAKSDSKQAKKSEASRQKETVEAVKFAAKRLGNRPATCRKYYVHPRVLEMYELGEMPAAIAHYQPPDKVLQTALDDSEQRTLAILETQK